MRQERQGKEKGKRRKGKGKRENGKRKNEMKEGKKEKGKREEGEERRNKDGLSAHVLMQQRPLPAQRVPQFPPPPRPAAVWKPAETSPLGPGLVRSGGTPRGSF